MIAAGCPQRTLVLAGESPLARSVGVDLSGCGARGAAATPAFRSKWKLASVRCCSSTRLTRSAVDSSMPVLPQPPAMPATSRAVAMVEDSLIMLRGLVSDMFFPLAIERGAVAPACRQQPSRYTSASRERVTA